MLGKGAETGRKQKRIENAIKLVPGRLMTEPVKFPGRLVALDKIGRKAIIRQSNPPLTIEDLHRILPVVVIDDIWTQEEEERFLGAFNNSMLYRHTISRQRNH
jgi:hypothetical protein